MIFGKLFLFWLYYLKRNTFKIDGFIALTTLLREWKDILYSAKSKLLASSLLGKFLQKIYFLRSGWSWWISWNMRFLLKQYRAIFSSMNIYFAIPPPPPFFFWPTTSKFHFLFLFSLNALGWKAGTKSISFNTNLFCPLSAQILSWLRSNYFLGIMNITPSTCIWCLLHLHLFLRSRDTATSSNKSKGFMLPFGSSPFPSNLHFSTSICLPPSGSKSVLQLYSFIFSMTMLKNAVLFDSSDQFPTPTPIIFFSLIFLVLWLPVFKN